MHCITLTIILFFSPFLGFLVQGTITKNYHCYYWRQAIYLYKYIFQENIEGDESAQTLAVMAMQPFHFWIIWSNFSFRSRREPKLSVDWIHEFCVCFFFFFFLFLFFLPLHAFQRGTKFIVHVRFNIVHTLFRYCLHTVHKTYSHFIQKKYILKMGHAILFTHLKIILLQCFQFSISAKISYIQMDPQTM